MKKTDILKISRHFNIPAEKIINVLNEKGVISKIMQDVMNINIAKDKYLASKENKKNRYFTEWLDACDSFESIEEVFVYAGNENEEKIVIRKWLNFCKTAEQAKEIFSCCPNNDLLISEILKVWVNLSNNFEEIREVKKYTKPDTEERKEALKKFLEFY